MVNTQRNSDSNYTVVIDAPVFDWSTTPLAEEYDGYYLKVLDNIFTSEECAALIALAESDQEWKQAAINYGLAPHENFVNTDYRNNERILRFDHEAAERIYRRLLPYVQEFVEIKAGGEWEGIVGTVSGTWKLVGLNERLAFLRYGPGHYFKSHCDGPLKLPDGREALLTVQIYLANEEVEGGATRIWGGQSDNDFIDIEPRKGRALIFQQQGIYHSGEEVIKGVKYALRSDFMFRHTDDS